ncbi:MAG: hypothetical protein R2712_22165 [Vicinamibacterales bacterium]
MAKRSRKTSATRARKSAARKSRSASSGASSTPAQFVFRGSVAQRGAATFDDVPLTRDTLVVHVDEILDGPPIMAGFEGADITVQLTKGQKATTGKAYVFHTNGWLFGEGLAVSCVKLVPESEGAVRQSRQALAAAPERALRERASQAELVVTGRVTEVSEAPRLPRAPITEHDPEWRKAVIAVDEVPATARRAGTRKPRQVVVRFPGSPDVRWAMAPKFTVGDTGVWFLGEKKATSDTQAVRAAAGAARNEYVVVSPDDYLPAEFAERVMTILNR